MSRRTASAVGYVRPPRLHRAFPTSSTRGWCRRMHARTCTDASLQVRRFEDDASRLCAASCTARRYLVTADAPIVRRRLVFPPWRTWDGKLSGLKGKSGLLFSLRLTRALNMTADISTHRDTLSPQMKSSRAERRGARRRHGEEAPPPPLDVWVEARHKSKRRWKTQKMNAPTATTGDQKTGDQKTDDQKTGAKTR
ncbi:uncharacterized protein LOC144068650 [Stigmatopora argus]